MVIALVVGGLVFLISLPEPRGEKVTREVENEPTSEWAEDGMPWVKHKLDNIQVGPLKLENSTLIECVEYLRLLSQENDPSPPKMSGVSFVVRAHRVWDHPGEDPGDELGGGGAAEIPINLKTGKIPLGEVLDLICEEVGYRWYIDPYLYKIVIQPKSMEYPPTGSLWPKPGDPVSGEGHESAPGDDPFGP